MNSYTIYSHLSCLHLEDFDLMLADLRELRGRVSHSRSDSDATRFDGLGRVEDTIAMVITALRYAIAAGESVSFSDLYRYDFCLGLRQAIINAVSINARNIDS